MKLTEHQKSLIYLCLCTRINKVNELIAGFCSKELIENY
jgi:hypothetical protein